MRYDQKSKIRGILNLAFDRRQTFSVDEEERHVAERTAGKGGPREIAK
jgi:hypothetical protein